MTQNKDTEKYDILFKDLLTKESSYEFFLKAQSSLKKELKKKPNSIEFLSLLKYSINHLVKFNEKESINALLNYSLEQFTQKNKKLPESIPKQDFVLGFMEAYRLIHGFQNSNNFRIKFSFYCKKNGIDEKTLRLYKCYDAFAEECICAKEYVEAYSLCIKSENINLLFELFDLFEKFSNDKKELDKINDDPFNHGKVVLKELSKEEFQFLIMRTTLELLMKKKIDIAFQFVGKYYKKINEGKNSENKNIALNFSYSLCCLLIREPKGFDHFWALINLYKGLIEQKYDIQFYLNQISVIYYNKPFLSENK
jgi:hypothetical protein